MIAQLNINSQQNKFGFSKETVTGYVDILFTRGSRTAATSKMEHFLITLNGLQPLIIITKCSILDVAAVLDPPLLLITINKLDNSFPTVQFQKNGFSRPYRFDRNVHDILSKLFKNADFEGNLGAMFVGINLRNKK